MKRTFARFTAVLLLSFFANEAAHAATGDQPINPQLSAEQVVAAMLVRNSEQDKSLSFYESTRHYRLEYKGFPSSKAAEIEVAMRFSSPGQKEFRIISEQGSGMLISKVLKKLLETEIEAAEVSTRVRSALSPENYRFELIGTDRLDGRCQYVLAVEPLRKDKLLYRGRIWVDATDFAVVQIEAEPARNPSFWISKTRIVHRYSKVGQFWLPAANQSESTTRLGGNARLTIEYTGYVFDAREVAQSTTENDAKP